MMSAIRTEKLSRTFGPVNAVDALDLEVKQGELFGLVGPDGAGKTTVMRLLTAIMPPTGGDAWVNGRHIEREAEAIKNDIGYMSQRFGLYPDLTVLENIHFYADLFGVPRRGRGEKIDELLGFSNLTPFQKRQAGRLSGGMKQKLGLACALVHTPRVLFLDEPTNGVDPVSRRDFWRILYKLLRQDVTIFVTTAYLDEAERCNRIGLIHDGRLLAAGTPEEVKRLVPGAILEVRCAQPRLASRALQASLHKATAGLFGDRVHVATRSPAASRAEIEKILVQEGIALQEIRAVEPSLEDVFVSVLGGNAVKGNPHALST